MVDNNTFPAFAPVSGLSITVTTPATSVPPTMFRISPTSILAVSLTLNTLSLGEAGAALVVAVSWALRVLGVKEGFTAPDAAPDQVISQV